MISEVTRQMLAHITIHNSHAHVAHRYDKYMNKNNNESDAHPSRFLLTLSCGFIRCFQYLLAFSCQYFSSAFHLSTAFYLAIYL